VSTPFAAIETATAANAVAALANATASIAGIAVPGVFDNGHAGSFGDLIADTAPSFAAAVADLDGLSVAVGGTVTIGAVIWTIARIEPDGTGMTRLILK
jgi:hypothetical protein